MSHVSLEESADSSDNDASDDEQTEFSWNSELRNMLSIALPNALQLFAAIGMSLTDMSVLGHYDTKALAAASFALLWMNLSMEMVYRGLCGATNVLCSQVMIKMM